mmetsp:Transcript_43919/g.70604  ORF Transcript_43919/g.70604 Transcript_43919/m.70604 type:complete len:209 (+) Transcript_43919:573-1199(+)
MEGDDGSSGVGGHRERISRSCRLNGGGGFLVHGRSEHCVGCLHTKLRLNLSSLSLELLLDARPALIRPSSLHDTPERLHLLSCRMPAMRRLDLHSSGSHIHPRGGGTLRGGGGSGRGRGSVLCRHGGERLVGVGSGRGLGIDESGLGIFAAGLGIFAGGLGIDGSGLGIVGGGLNIDSDLGVVSGDGGLGSLGVQHPRVVAAALHPRD